MNTENSNPIVSWLWKIPAIAIAHFIGVMIAGAVITAAKMQWPTYPGSASETENLIVSLIGSVFMAACLALIARGIRGSQAVRWLIVAVFSYVVFGLNNQIEAAIFTTYGGTPTMLVFFILPSVFGAAAAVHLFRPEQPDVSLESVITSQPVSMWWWRPIVAWLAFPVIYVFFGMLASPFVVPVYETQDFGLTLPGFGTMLPVALARSALYLAVTVPVLVTWSRSRRSLLWSLAVVFFAMMGLIGLLSATFFPPVLRVTHSIEILGDAVVYAWLLVALFIPKVRQQSDVPVAALAD
jgi:hypothetical protein